MYSHKLKQKYQLQRFHSLYLGIFNHLKEELLHLAL